MRIYISADIEGIAGVVSKDNCSPGRFEFEPARDWMTDAVLSACEAARELGAEEVVVSDSHGTGQNIRFERMPGYVQLVRSWPRPLGMMQGIESGAYAGAFLIGYHAGSTTVGGTLSHTVSGRMFQEIRLNGQVVSEAVISAATAGHYGVPVLMLAGDDVAVEETRSLLPGVATACLKQSHGYLSATTISPAAADARLRQAVGEAIGLTGRVQPYVLPGPIDVQIRFSSRYVAEWFAYLERVERIDAFTTRLQNSNIVEVSKTLQFLAFAHSATE